MKLGCLLKNKCENACVSYYKDKTQFDHCFWQGTTPVHETGWQMQNPQDFSMILELGINWDGINMIKVFSLRDQKTYYVNAAEMNEVT